jgi:hypothetical protein
VSPQLSSDSQECESHDFYVTFSSNEFVAAEKSQKCIFVAAVQHHKPTTDALWWAKKERKFIIWKL